MFPPDIDLWTLSWSCFQDEPDSRPTDTQTTWAQHTSQEKLLRTHSATIVSRSDWFCEHCHGLLSTKRGFGWQGLWNNRVGGLGGWWVDCLSWTNMKQCAVCDKQLWSTIILIKNYNEGGQYLSSFCGSWHRFVCFVVWWLLHCLLPSADRRCSL